LDKPVGLLKTQSGAAKVARFALQAKLVAGMSAGSVPRKYQPAAKIPDGIVLNSHTDSCGTSPEPFLAGKKA